MNLFANPSFEDGWIHRSVKTTKDGWYYLDGEGTVAEIQIPNGWSLRYADDSCNCNPYNDGQPWSKLVRPEVRVLPRNQLPLNEQDLYVLDGDYTMKIFKGSGAFCAGIRQDLTLISGLYSVEVPVFADAVSKYDGDKKIWATDPVACNIRFIVGAKSTEWETLVPGDLSTPTHEFEIVQDGIYSIGFDFLMPFALKQNGVFFDDVSIEFLEEIEPDECRGKPRVQYRRTFNVLRQETTRARAHEILDLVFDKKQTLGWSSDDAGLGDLDDKTAVEWDVLKAKQPEYSSFYANNYEGTKLVFEGTQGQSGQPTYPLPAEYLGIHRQTNIDGLYEYYAKVKPEWVKLVYGIEDAQRTKESGAKKVVYRKPVAHQGQYIQSLDVNNYLKEYDPTNLEKHIDYLDAIEGTNEENPNDPKVLEFEMLLSNEVRRRWGDDILLVSGNWAVGNGEGQTLLEWARVLMKNKHIAGYHPYFPVDPKNAEAWMESDAKWYHLRHLLYIDPIFRENGVYVQWLGTESGAVRAYQYAATSRMMAYIRREPLPSCYFDPEWTARKNAVPLLAPSSMDSAIAAYLADVGALDPGGGWRHPDALNADLPRYIRLLLTLRKMRGDWNKENGNRDRGNTIFTVGATFVGWDHFKMWQNDLNYLGTALTA